MPQPVRPGMLQRCHAQQPMTAVTPRTLHQSSVWLSANVICPLRQACIAASATAGACSDTVAWQVADTQQPVLYWMLSAGVDIYLTLQANGMVSEVLVRSADKILARSHKLPCYSSSCLQLHCKIPLASVKFVL